MSDVRQNGDLSRFEILVDGTVAGFAEYHDHGNRRTFTHTVVDDAFEGQGLGAALVRHILDDARRNGLDVVPVCPFVREYIARHRDQYVDLVPADDREKFDL
ncbi:MAG TPA: GNAT family N-acetyltransferase [Mycobacteriales bacterium]|nr:GNAT family N-acetyltransferase [Mycobacteriales bacterium]